jgi:hypothetical protein
MEQSNNSRTFVEGETVVEQEEQLEAEGEGYGACPADNW